MTKKPEQSQLAGAGDTTSPPGAPLPQRHQAALPKSAGKASKSIETKTVLGTPESSFLRPMLYLTVKRR